MTQERVNTYLLTNKDYFPTEKMPFIKEALSKVPDEKADALMFTEFKQPVTMLLFSLFLGFLGVDRFMLGEVGMGVLKLLTCGGCGIWAIIDWFIILNKTKEKNFDQLMQTIQLL